MAQITFKKFSDWGMCTFCVIDYRDWLSENGFKNKSWEDFTFAGLVLFDDDNEETIKSFLYMAMKAKADIICVEYSNINDDYLYKKFQDIECKIIGESGHYIDLQSYERRSSWGRMLWKGEV